MAPQMSFGTILRDAREKKRLDLTSVARRLRIRPDILEAIEDADFSRMPPRGYTRNMVNAYAHFLGLNATDVTRMYLDECYAYQVGSARKRTASDHGFDMDSGRGRNIPHGQLRDNGSGRRRYSDNYRTEETSRMQRLRNEQNGTHRSRRSAIEDVQYMNFYSGPRASEVKPASKLPFIVAGVVILVLVIVVCVLLFSPKSSSVAPEQQVMPVTGVSEQGSSSDSGQGQQQQEETKPVETAPTKTTVSYEVVDGGQAYIEVYVDDVVKEADTIDGPSESSYDVTGTIMITVVPYTTDPVKIMQDGKEIELTDGGSGIYTVEIDFQEVLDEWKAAHPDAASSDEASENSQDGQDAGTSTQSQENAS